MNLTRQSLLQKLETVRSSLNYYNLELLSLTRWEAEFKTSSSWANDVHFALMSYLHNIRFEFYVVDHENNDQLMPRGGVLGDGSVIDEYAGHEPAITIMLLHNTADLVSQAAADPNNHFDLLYFDADEELKTKIRECGYTISQDEPAAMGVGLARPALVLAAEPSVMDEEMVL